MLQLFVALTCYGTPMMSVTVKNREVWPLPTIDRQTQEKAGMICSGTYCSNFLLLLQKTKRTGKYVFRPLWARRLASQQRCSVTTTTAAICSMLRSKQKYDLLR
ncbi:hypothetical protein NPIL_162491 [Nephila pilipes]|uniref:Uncharacterized protein n=1 Tax=Nephila pilipes TaxID=299642 RepID=A0A8X6PDE6_NEPPI|nr:hypothetical protein NPIL_162491 [Nephila pilipes]